MNGLLNLILPLLKTARGLAAGILLLQIASVALLLAQPKLAGELSQSITGNAGDAYPIVSVLIVWYMCILLRAILGYLVRVRLGRMEEQFAQQIREHLFTNLQWLKASYFNERKSGSVVSTFTTDTEILGAYFPTTILTSAPQLLVLFGSAYIIFSHSPLLAALCLVLVPSALIAIKLSNRKIASASREWVETYSSFISHIEQYVDAAIAVKLFNREDLEQDRFHSIAKKLREDTNKQTILQASIQPVSVAIGGAVVLALVGVGANEVVGGMLDAEELVEVIFASLLLLQALNSAAAAYGESLRVLAAGERIERFLKEPREPAAPATKAMAGKLITIENVSLRFEEGPEVFQNFNLQIQQGDKIAMLGPNGSGKSSLANLLAGLIEADSGQIHLGETSKLTTHPRDLRRLVSSAPQRLMFTDSSVRQNVTFGRPDASEEDVNWALEVSCSMDFIRKLPDGLGSRMGSQGAKFSGGQLQRIALARALLKDAPILILDEAMSMIDFATRTKIEQNLEPVISKKTVLLIQQLNDEAVAPESISFAGQLFRVMTFS